MKYFTFLFLFLCIFSACSKKEEPAPISTVGQVESSLQDIIKKREAMVKHNVIDKALTAVNENRYFETEKKVLLEALNTTSTQNAFYDCSDYEKDLFKAIQIQYSAVFAPDSWQRKELEKSAAYITKYECIALYSVRADFLSKLQEALSEAEDLKAFSSVVEPMVKQYVLSARQVEARFNMFFEEIAQLQQKIREIFIPIDSLGYNSYKMENDYFTQLNPILTNIIEGLNKNYKDASYKTPKSQIMKVDVLIQSAKEEEKQLFSFLKVYDGIYQANKECVNRFFGSLQAKWFSFADEMIALSKEKRTAFANDVTVQASSGLQKQCPALLSRPVNAKSVKSAK